MDRHLAARLGKRLDAAASAKSADFWNRYLKGTVPFRGVPMGEIRRALHAWWRLDGPAGLSLPAQKNLALQLFAGEQCEDKLAGVLALREILLDELTLADVDRLGALFDQGLIADWNSCDWFCVKTLGALVARELPDRRVADAIAGWRAAESLWRRRAANVAFVNLAGKGDENFAGFTALMLETCAVTVRSPERFAQTGVGWLLRELAEADRAAVLAFTEAHLARLSREAVRSIVARMPESVRVRTLRRHADARGRSRSPGNAPAPSRPTRPARPATRR